MVAYLRRTDVIDVSKATLKRIHYRIFRIMQDLGDLDNSSIEEVNASTAEQQESRVINVRIFLAGELITRHPDRVFEHMNDPLVRSLRTSADRLRESFLGICRRIREGVQLTDIPREELGVFPERLLAYMDAFKTWKIPDESRLVGRIRHALRALYDARAQIPMNAGEAIQLDFDTQIRRLEGKLVMLAGQAVLDEFHAMRNSNALPPLETAEPVQGPPARMVLGSRMTNEQLAHAVLLDPSFQLGDDAIDEYDEFSRVYFSMQRDFVGAFWDSLREDLSASGANYVRLCRVIKEIGSGLADLRPMLGANRFMELSDERIATEMANPAEFMFQLYPFISGSLAPRREPQSQEAWAPLLQELREMQDADSVTRSYRADLICRAAQFMLKQLNLARVDSANARLRLIEPVIRDHGVEYERTKFNERVQAGQGIEKTKAFIKRGVDAVPMESRSAIVRDVGTLMAFFRDTFMDLLFDREIQIPESLDLDETRIGYLRKGFQRLLVACAVTARLFSYSTAARRALPESASPLRRGQRLFHDILFDQVVAFLKEAVGTEVTVQSFRAAINRVAVSTQERAYVDGFYATAEDCLVPTSSIRTRILGFVEDIVSSYLDTRVFNSTNMMVLEFYKDQFLQLADLAYRIVDVNFKVHSLLYKNTVQQIVGATPLAIETRIQRPEAFIETRFQGLDLSQSDPFFIQAPPPMVWDFSSPQMVPVALVTHLPVVTLGPVVTHHFALPMPDGSTMMLDFFACDTPRDRFVKANVGLYHARPMSPEQLALNAILHEAVRNGGA